MQDCRVERERLIDSKEHVALHDPGISHDQCSYVMTRLTGRLYRGTAPKVTKYLQNQPRVISFFFSIDFLYREFRGDDEIQDSTLNIFVFNTRDVRKSRSNMRRFW